MSYNYSLTNSPKVYTDKIGEKLDMIKSTINCMQKDIDVMQSMVRINIVINL